ncbi:hypothetical protein Btru_050670 [Bulinus truncatus]|nr:hypothetical protein Btru_050670 [Bulinus truncatus]
MLLDGEVERNQTCAGAGGGYLRQGCGTKESDDSFPQICDELAKAHVGTPIDSCIKNVYENRGRCVDRASLASKIAAPRQPPGVVTRWASQRLKWVEGASEGAADRNMERIWLFSINTSQSQRHGERYCVLRVSSVVPPVCCVVPVSSVVPATHIYQDVKKDKERKKRPKRRTTHMLLTITVVYVVTYFSTVILIFVRSVADEVILSLRPVWASLYSLFFNLFLLNCCCESNYLQLVGPKLQKRVQEIVKKNDQEMTPWIIMTDSRPKPCESFENQECSI